MTERYEIRRKIGQGGVGAVYKAFDTKLQRDVALKRLLPLVESKQTEGAAEALKREASLISSLRNPNIVTVYDAGTDEDGVFVVMELIQGQTLDRIVRNAALRQDDFVQVVEQSLGGLIAAQDAGLLHRDLKPKNIMIAWLPSGNFQLKILDFGLAKFSVKPTRQTVDHGDTILGSIHYMAPEQFERHHLDARTDLYSMGCVYYFSLAQRYAFRGETPGDVMMSHLHHEVKHIRFIRQDISPGYCNWIMKLISRNPKDRPADARAALQEFRAIDTSHDGRIAQLRTAAPIAVTIPALEKATASPHLAATGPVTASQRAAKAAAAPLASPVTTAQKKPPRRAVKKQRRKVILFGAFAILLVIALLAFKVYQANSKDAAFRAPDIPPLPLPANRVAHYIADWGVFAGDGMTAARKHDAVAVWRDATTDKSGDNSVQPPAERGARGPALESASREDGLNGPHPVIRFRRGDGLIATRAGSGPQEDIGNSLDTNQLSYFIAFRPGAAAHEHCVLSIDFENPANACVTSYREGAIQSGLRREGIEDSLSSTSGALGSFVLLTFVWDGNREEQSQTVTVPAGTRMPGTPGKAPSETAKFARIRFGGGGDSNETPENLFEGDIAEVILYNKALSAADQKAVEAYLFKKYFGK